MGVGQGDGLLALGSIGSGSGVTSGGVHFLNAVVVIAAIGLLDQAGPGIAPTVSLIQFNSFITFNSLAVLGQLNGDGLGTDAVLVVSVVPGLGDGDGGTGQSAGNTGHGECQLGAVRQSQVSLLVGGIELTFLKTNSLIIDLNGIAVGIGIGSGIAVGGNLSIAQVPGVGVILTGNEAVASIDHGDHVSHGVGDRQTCTIQALGDGLGNGSECSIQLSGVVGIIGTAGRCNAIAQECTDFGTVIAEPAALIGEVISNAEADGIQVSALVLDSSCLCSCLAVTGGAAGTAGAAADVVSRCTVSQQDNALGTGNGIQQTGSGVQAALQVGTTIGTHAIDSSDSSIVRILTCTASHIDPFQLGGIAGCECNDGQLTICRSVSTCIGCQEVLGSSLSCSHAASALRATTIMSVLTAAISTECHRAGHVHDQNHSTAIGNSRSGLGCLHLQGDLKLVVAKSLCGLGQGNTIVISNGTDTAFGPGAIAILTIGGSFSSRCGCGHYGQHEAGRQQDAEDFVKHLFHLLTSL